ncbi:2-oxoglutarate dehydrogenase complex component E1-like [Diorhabda sublineata]|uniref:2-oxoglutarate dehydrogenase complex component E1-like n=1 Tax=Diorhabda sublineata TaxID=1163346 RepID=UPI0024E0FAA1|nr:2-oxoglutarate dehydrogenase complex component E1-like [Diorhabda sublineata]
MNQLVAVVLNSSRRILFDKVLKCRTHKNVDPPKIQSSSEIDSFLSGSSAQYIEDMYNIWLNDPTKVHASWDSFFRNSTDGAVGYFSPPTLGTVPRQQEAGSSGLAPSEETVVSKHMAVQAIIRGYQVRGHLLAKLDPLGTTVASRDSKNGGDPPDIISPYYKIDPADMDRKFKLPKTTSIGGKEKYLPLRDIISRLETAYCENIGLEYMFINSVEQCDWIRDKFEPPGSTEIPVEKKKLTLARLARAQLFETFCAKKYPSEKRFGLDGLESLIPCLKTIMDRSSELGVEMFVIGMAHRGRLNILVNVCRKSLVHTFAFFEPLQPFEHCSGDVKYHLGVFTARMNRVTNKNVKIVLIANPSHLGCSFPAVLGKVRGEQFFKGDVEGKKVMAIIIHGDAALTGQGVNFEIMNISEVPCYTTHGVLHIVANNQIGFTTDKKVQGSSPYCTDIARSINAPIMHVNADCPEKVVYVSKVAAEWRQKFGRDVVIDLVGYRRYGHQEIDDPNFTQPVLYKRISKMVPVFDQYARKLVNEKIVSENEVNNIRNEYLKILEDEFQKSKQEKHLSLKDWLDSPWDAFFEGKDENKMKPTGVKEETLQHICQVVSSLPPDSAKFVLHKGLVKVLKNRKDMLAKRTVDWAMGEACGFGSLLKEGIPVRMTGEDVERGTFSHRHHVYHHQDIENETYCPLHNLYPDQANYTVCNSTLAEYAIMGFEHGYSFVSPNALVIWEAQFGDFANTGQPIIDQMISSSEDKWARQSGFVLQLPHGLEGGGPEHSSCRPERLLDMVSEDPDVMPPEDIKPIQHIKNINWLVTYCSTPANHFHALRRQILLPFRKPLVMLAPKAILRYPEARSSFDEMKEGTEFKWIIPDDGPAGSDPAGVQKVMFCSGKVFYDIKKVVKEKHMESKIALIRIEQLAPFPFSLVKKEIQKYPKAKICWLQEEHKNQGFWDHMEPRLRTILKALKDPRDVSYVGRAVSASPATGFRFKHGTEIRQLQEDALKI